MLECVLAKALTVEQRRAGLYLSEPDDHTLQLKRGDEVLAAFNSTAVAIQSIWEEADKYLFTKGESSEN